MIFVVVAALLGFTGYHFGVRTVRWFAGIAALGLALAVTKGLRIKAAQPDAAQSRERVRPRRRRGRVAFFRPLGLGSPAAGPGRAPRGGWSSPSCWCSATGRLRPGRCAGRHRSWTSPSSAALSRASTGRPGGRVSRRPDRRSASRAAGGRGRFRLAAMEVCAPDPARRQQVRGLATIAEASGFSGGGLAGAIIRFFGMLWPNPRLVQLRVWVEPARRRRPRARRRADLARVTVELDDPGTGATLSTKTLAAESLDEAATRVAGYVARQSSARTRATPAWCFGASDGADLSALLLSRQHRVPRRHPRRPRDFALGGDRARCAGSRTPACAPGSSATTWPSSTASRECPTRTIWPRCGCTRSTGSSTPVPPRAATGWHVAGDGRGPGIHLHRPHGGA